MKMFTDDILEAAKEVSKSDEIENTEIAFDIDEMKDVDLAVARIQKSIIMLTKS